jgi:hypothetical protein
MSLAAAAMLVLAATASAAPAPRQLDLTAFFTGRTRAENDLKIVFHRTTKLIVDSVGHVDGNTFVLVDTVHEGDKPVRTRKWVMHQIGPGRFGGTLTDATGPVDMIISGDTATVRYVMKDGGLSVVQQMQLKPDGTIANHVDVKKLGLRFARVDGIIRKLD